MKVIEQLIDYLSQRDLLTQEHFDRLREQGFDAHIPAEIRERWELKEKESPGRSKPVIEDLTDVERLHEQLELQTLRGRSPGAGKNGRQRRRLERIAAAARDLGHRAAHAMEGCDHALKPFVVVARSLGVGTIDSWRDAARVIAQAEFLNDIIPWLAEAYETEEKSSEREIAEFQERVAEVFRGSSHETIERAIASIPKFANNVDLCELTRIRVIEDLAHLGRGALPALIAFQSDPNGRIREAGTRAVKRVHSENVQFSDNEPRDCDPVVLQAILQRVNELVAPDNTCRFWASIALEQIRISTRARKTVALQKATAKCLTGLSSPDANIRLEVASFLGRVAGCEEIVPLRACVQDETEVLEIRCNAFRSLVEIGFDVGDLALSAADSLLAVRKEVANSQSFFRCRAFIEAVGNLESSADSFIPILFDLQRSLPENEPSQVPQVPKRP